MQPICDRIHASERVEEEERRGEQKGRAVRAEKEEGRTSISALFASWISFLRSSSSSLMRCRALTRSEESINWDASKAALARFAIPAGFDDSFDMMNSL